MKITSINPTAAMLKSFLNDIRSKQNNGKEHEASCRRHMKTPFPSRICFITTLLKMPPVREAHRMDGLGDQVLLMNLIHSMKH